MTLDKDHQNNQNNKKVGWNIENKSKMIDISFVQCMCFDGS